MFVGFWCVCVCVYNILVQSSVVVMVTLGFPDTLANPSIVITTVQLLRLPPEEQDQKTLGLD